MMKKMVSMAMAAVMALTLAVAVAPTVAKAADETDSAQTTDVVYTHTNDLTEDGADYIITIPQGIELSKTTKSVDASVTITAKDGTAYAGASSVTVSVASQNGYKLMFNGAGVAYELSYNGNDAFSGKEASVVGTLSTSQMKVSGTAAITADLTALSLEAGEYTDILTYTIATQ